MSGHIQAVRVWSATETHLKMTCGGLGGVQQHLGGRMSLRLLLLLSRGPLKFGKQWWRLLFIVQRGITQHISYSPLTGWEGLTLLTVNYRRPISPLRRCGLFISDLISLSERLLLCLESSTTARKEIKCCSILRIERRARHDINWCLLDILNWYITEKVCVAPQ